AACPTRCSNFGKSMSKSTGQHQPNRRVLIIDDNEAIHEDFRKILSGDSASAAVDEAEARLFGAPQPNRLAAFEIDSAFQGQQGLERVRQATAAAQPYALAFVDVRMPPGWDGVETTAQLWQADPDLHIVIC